MLAPRALIAVLLLAGGACQRSNPAYRADSRDGAAGSGGGQGGANGGSGGNQGDANGGAEAPPADAPDEASAADGPRGDRSRDFASDMHPDQPPDAAPCTIDDECAPAFCNAGSCEDTPRFAAPQALPLEGNAVLCPQGDEALYPVISADGNELVYTCVSDVGGELYRSTKKGSSGTWQSGTKLTGFGDGTMPLPSQLSRDGKRLYLALWPGAAPPRALVFADRPSPGAVAFNTPSPIPGLTSANENDALWMSPDEHLVYFSSKRKGTSLDCGVVDTDIYWSSRTMSDGVFSAISKASPPSSDAWDSKPTLPDHLRFMVFYRADTDCASDNQDLYVAWRSAPGTAWSTAVPLDGVNGPASDLWPTLTPDGRTLVFSTWRNGTPEIFIARR